MLSFTLSPEHFAVAWEGDVIGSLIFHLFGDFLWWREICSGKREKYRSTSMFKLRRLLDSSKGSLCPTQASSWGKCYICIPFFHLSFSSHLLFISPFKNGRQNNFIGLSKQCLSQKIRNGFYSKIHSYFTIILVWSVKNIRSWNCFQESPD